MALDQALSVESRASSLDVFAKALGRMADLLAKHAAEVGWVFEADLRGDLGDTVLGVAQQILRLLDPIAAQIFPRRYSKLVQKNPTQIILADADCAGDLLP